MHLTIKTMRFKWPKSQENLKEDPQSVLFVGQKSIVRYYYIQIVKDGVKIRVYMINKESVTQFCQFISVTVKGTLRKSQAQFREKLRKLRLRPNYCFYIRKFLTKKRVQFGW